MAGFAIYETVNLRAKFKKTGVLTDYKTVLASIKQENVLLEYSTDDENVTVDEEIDTVYVYLSQEDTAKFKKGCAKFQINVYYEDEERNVSCIAQLQIRDNLHKEVMS